MSQKKTSSRTPIRETSQHGRAARVLAVLFLRGEITVRDAQEISGLTTSLGARYMLDAFSLTLPINEEEGGRYALLPEFYEQSGFKPPTKRRGRDADGRSRCVSDLE